MTIGSASHLTRRSLLATATMSALGLAIPPAFAQARLDEVSIAATAQHLQPGQFLGAPEAAPEPPGILAVHLRQHLPCELGRESWGERVRADGELWGEHGTKKK